MSSLQELQRIDRELSSELMESPINPAFLHMSTPLKSEYNPPRQNLSRTGLVARGLILRAEVIHEAQ